MKKILAFTVLLGCILVLLIGTTTVSATSYSIHVIPGSGVDVNCPPAPLNLKIEAAQSPHAVMDGIEINIGTGAPSHRPNK